MHEVGANGSTVEVDESYVGGKPRHANNPASKEPTPSKRGRGTNKQPIMVLVERDGSSRAMPISAADGETLIGAARQLVDPSATINTDEWTGYRGIDQHFSGGHHVVKHSAKEYVRYEQCGAVYVSTNTAESWFALFKRSFIGIHHQMSKTHLHRYCNERSFMWNHRHVSDGDRFVLTIQQSEGKRLMYRKPNGGISQ